jgi:hypothetical protein
MLASSSYSGETMLTKRTMRAMALPKTATNAPEPIVPDAERGQTQFRLAGADVSTLRRADRDPNPSWTPESTPGAVPKERFPP